MLGSPSLLYNGLICGGLGGLCSDYSRKQIKQMKPTSIDRIYLQPKQYGDQASGPNVDMAAPYMNSQFGCVLTS